MVTHAVLVTLYLSVGATAPTNRIPDAVSEADAIKRAIGTAASIECTFFQPKPPSRVVIRDVETAKKLSAAMKFKDVKLAPTARIANNHVFGFRVFGQDGRLLVSFTLIGEDLVFFGQAPAYRATLESVDFYRLVYAYFRDEPEPEPSHDKLKFVASYQDKTGSLWGNGNAVAVSNNGNFVYVADGAHDALLTYVRSHTSGKLMLSAGPQYQCADVPDRIPRAKPHDHLSMPVDLAVSSDDRFVYLAAEFSHAITVFRGNRGVGISDPIQVVKSNRDGMGPMEQPQSVVLSPDGRNAYVVAKTSRALVVFARDPDEGTLTFVQSHPEEESPSYAAISPDGKHIYVVCHKSSVSCYQRNERDGRVERVQLLRDARYKPGEPLPDNRGLKFASSVMVSRDGKNVYVTSLRRGVSAWARNAESGELEFLQRLDNGMEGTDGLDYALSLTMNPADTLVYVAAQKDSALTVFERQKLDGKLRFLEVVKDDPPNVEGMLGARAVAISPDGKHVYVGTGVRTTVVLSTVPGLRPF